ncbi:hypothetical protein M2T82_04410 [Elizabethkingia ursingii]|uniref:hypothetical protein n=1 Tax=Elizabethkingia ursingii TaxID=1756150 RepID=UPI002011B825|nr:hypothetical protein [Elizabethkingia ursingii]MCL1667299.1 hypothetical protein [Elizabethkingia ursingii]
MKKYALLFLVLLSGWSYACVCGYRGIVAQFQDVDFVGEIKIIEVDSKVNNDGEVFVKIKPIKAYKGKAPIGFYADISSSCRIYPKVGEKLLVYFYLNKVIPHVHQCTRMVNLLENIPKNKEEIKVIKYLSRNKFSDKGVSLFFDPSTLFENYKYLKVNNNFSVIRITSNKDSTGIKTMNILQSFGTKKDEEIYKIVMEKGILLKDYNDEASDHIVILYYNVNGSNRGVVASY